MSETPRDESKTQTLTAFQVLERYVDAKIGMARRREVGIDLMSEELAEAEAHLKALFEGRGLIVTKRQILRTNDEDLHDY